MFATLVTAIVGTAAADEPAAGTPPSSTEAKPRPDEKKAQPQVPAGNIKKVHPILRQQLDPSTGRPFVMPDLSKLTLEQKQELLRLLQKAQERPQLGETK